MPDPTVGVSNNGPAPEPTRSISLDETTPNTEVSFNPETHEVSTPPGAPDIQATPPPETPDLAAQIAEIRANYGQAINALGDERKLRKEMEQRIAELQLQLEAQVAAAQQQAPTAPQTPATPQPQLPPGYTEEQLAEAPTYRDMLVMGQQLALHNQQLIEKAQADFIRSTWDVTPEQEREILNRFPTYNQLPELQKVHQIKRAVDLLLKPKEAAAPVSPDTLPPAPTAPAQSPSAPTPLATAPVPHVEHAAVPAQDMRPVSAEAQAMAEYVAARAITNPREREKAMTAAAENLARARGTSLDEMTSQYWKV